jgi:RHS repeat-associated protein
VEVPQQNGQGRVHARFFSNASATYRGVVLEGYEHRRFQQGASPVWTPLRFPGQYHDVETDLFENWNRYYDPSAGKYLSPDPMAAEPLYVLGEAGDGRNVSAYDYANSNPLILSDPSGLAEPIGDYAVDGSAISQVEAAALHAEVAADILAFALKEVIKEVVTNPLGADDAEAPGLSSEMGEVPSVVAAAGKPGLPDKTIVNSNGVLVQHYYKSGDHPPAHAHVTGEGYEVKIGVNGNPLKGEAELSSKQAKVVADNRKKVRKAMKQIVKYLKK